MKKTRILPFVAVIIAALTIAATYDHRGNWNVNGKVIATDVLSGTALQIGDSNATNTLTVDWSEDDTSNRAFNLAVGSGDRTLTLNENFTVGDGTNITITGEDNAGTITLDNATFEVERPGTGTQRALKLSIDTDADAELSVSGTTGVINQDVTDDSSPQFASVQILDTASDNELTLDWSEDGGGDYTLNFAVGGAGRTLTFNENLTVSDGNDVTFLAEDVAGSITLDNASLEIEDTAGSANNMKLTVGTDAAAALAIEGSSGVINQDLTTDANVSFTQATVGNTGLVVGASTPFSDSTGTLTLQTVDALDATTEGTIETAIDTLANLTNIQSQSVTLAGELHVEAATHVNQDMTSDAGPQFARVGLATASVAGTAITATGTPTSAWVANIANTGTANYSHVMTLTSADEDNSSAVFYVSSAAGEIFHLKADRKVSTYSYSGGYANDLCISATGGNVGVIGTCSSSLKFKKGVKDMKLSDSSKIYSLRPVEYKWKRNDKDDFGLVADEVVLVYPRLINYAWDEDLQADVIDGINYRHLISLFLDQLQEHETKIDDLTTDVNNLKQRVDDLETQAIDFEARIAALESP